MLTAHWDFALTETLAKMTDIFTKHLQEHEWHISMRGMQGFIQKPY